MPSYVRPGIRKCAKNRALSKTLGFMKPSEKIIELLDAA